MQHINSSKTVCYIGNGSEAKLQSRVQPLRKGEGEGGGGEVKEKVEEAAGRTQQKTLTQEN